MASWPWPLTPCPKINLVPPLIVHNLHVKFESDWAKTVVCIVSTRQSATDAPTHPRAAALLYPIQRCCEGIIKRVCWWNTNALGGDKVQNWIYQYKGHDQGNKVINLGVIWKGFISWVCIPNMKSVSLRVQQLWPRLKIFLARESDTQSHRQTGQKLNAPEFHSGGIKRSKWYFSYICDGKYMCRRIEEEGGCTVGLPTP